jgi:hypothetical protein
VTGQGLGEESEANGAGNPVLAEVRPHVGKLLQRQRG